MGVLAGRERSPGAGSKLSSRVSNFTGSPPARRNIQKRIARQSPMRCQSVKSKKKGGLSLAGWFASGAENSESRRKLHTNQGAHGHRHRSARGKDHGLR